MTAHLKRSTRRARNFVIKRGDHDAIPEKTPGMFATKPGDENGRLCPSCGFWIRLTSHGVMRSHAPAGHKRRKDTYPCPGEDLGRM